MTLAQIRCFLEVANCQSFSRAAARMFISQPAVSKQIRLLEEDLKLPLLDRSSAAPQLTEAGKLFYEFFRRSNEDFQGVWKQAKRLSRREAGGLNIGCLDGWDITAMYPELQSISTDIGSAQSPNLFGYNHLQLVEKLLEDEIDLALSIDISLRRAPELSVRKMLSVPLVLLLSRQHPLADREALTLCDLRDEPFYVIAPEDDGENAMEELIVTVCQEAGFTPAVEHVPSSASALMRLQGSVGAQLTTAMTGACKLPSYRAVILTRMLDVSVAWMDNGRNPVKFRFIDELRDHFSS